METSCFGDVAPVGSTDHIDIAHLLDVDVDELYEHIVGLVFSPSSSLRVTTLLPEPASPSPVTLEATAQDPPMSPLVLLVSGRAPSPSHAITLEALEPPVPTTLDQPPTPLLRPVSAPAPVLSPPSRQFLDDSQPPSPPASEACGDSQAPSTPVPVPRYALRSASKRNTTQRFISQTVYDFDVSDASDDDEPTLPPPPARHPHTGVANSYSIGDYGGADEEYEVYQLLDRRYTKPHRAYLVQWYDVDKRFVATWEWQSVLQANDNSIVKAGMRWVDKWKDKHKKLTYGEYKARFPFAFTASYNGLCFFNAMRLASIVKGKDDMVPGALIESFIQVKADQNKSVTCGTVKSDISDFVSYLQNNRTPLACDQFRKNCLTQSINSVKDLNDTPLESGVYVVGAADQRGIRHCFVLQVHEDTKNRLFHDELYEEDDNIAYTTMPLVNAQWIRRCMFVRKVVAIGKIRRPRGDRGHRKKKKC